MNIADQICKHIDEISREDLDDAVATALADTLNGFLKEVDNKDGDRAEEILWHAILLDPDKVKKAVDKAVAAYHRLAPKVEED
jgi:hypothetical protein